MTPNDRHIDEIWVLSRDLSHKLCRTDAVKSGHSNNLHWIQTLLLVQFCHGGHYGVDRVDNQSKNGIGTMLGASFDQTFCYVSVDLEQVIPGLAGLSWHACRNKYQIAIFKAILIKLSQRWL